MSFNIQNVVIGGQDPFFLLGPCSLENEAFAWEMATAIKET
jgi:2-dehydro-3-deoxyphosphooctonate aldolase (KDO 8-P synthase)